MNLMSNARLFHDDVENNRNDLMFDMLPQVKFNMMGQIQHEMKKSPSPYSSSSLSSRSSSPNNTPSEVNTTTGSPPTRTISDKSKCQELDDSGFRRGDSAVQQRRPGRTVGRYQEDSPHHPSHSEDSPLDFSNKKHKYEKAGLKVKGSKKQGKISQEKSKGDDEDPDSPSTRLRHMLKMKSPCSPVFLKDLSVGTVLNLSKDSASPVASIDWNHIRNNTNKTNSSYSSSSPTDMDIHSSFIPSPRAATVPGDGPGTYPFPFSSTMAQSLALSSPYSIFNTNLSPMSHQSSVTPTPFDPPHPSMFQQGEFSGPFGPLPPSSSSPSTNSASGKSRVTRPFKAYPKDPLTFPTVGLYGIPTAGPTHGVNESLVHQQSNHAYAEFRKQMLNQSGNSRSKRSGGQTKNGHIQGPLQSDSTTSSTNPSDFGLGGGLSGSDAMTNGSGGEDCLSTSDDGYCGGTQAGQLQNRLNKPDEQHKDEAYWERRRKNNEAAKRSRDARRAKEDEIAIRAAFLEQENLKLRFEVCALKNETAKLRCMLYKA